MKATLSTRKQSHDNRGRDQMSNTMGSGLGVRRDNGILSPRSVISGARQQVLSNTISEGLEIKAGRKEGWDNPNSSARNALGMRDGDLSIQDIVDSMLKKQAFGIDDYNPKPVVKDLLPVHTHVRAKSKRRMFCDEAIRAKDKVPAPNKYQSAIDWHKDPTSRNIKFYKDARKTVADEIIHKSKFLEKSTPGPAGHDAHDGWKKTLKKVGGTMSIKEARITFVQERSWFANQSPGNKYPSIDLVSKPKIAAAPLQIKIN